MNNTRQSNHPLFHLQHVPKLIVGSCLYKSTHFSCLRTYLIVEPGELTQLRKTARELNKLLLLHNYII